MLLEIIYYLIITILAVVLFANLATRKNEKLPLLVSLAVVVVVFALRALHIK